MAKTLSAFSIEYPVESVATPNSRQSFPTISILAISKACNSESKSDTEIRIFRISFHSIFFTFLK